MLLFQNNTLSGTPNKVILVNGIVTGNASWPRIVFGGTVMPYLINGRVDVKGGATLTIAPEVVIKFKLGSSFIQVYNDGALILQSSPGKEVVFTSERDDTYGGDSNGDGDFTKPAPGDWAYVWINNADNALHDSIFRYGGSGSGVKGMLWIEDCSPDITSCRLEHVTNTGLYYNGDISKASTLSGNTIDTYNTAFTLRSLNPATVVKDNTITGSTSYPVQLLDGAMPVFQNNTITNSVHKVIAVSGDINTSVTWPVISFGTTPMPYLVNGSFTSTKAGRSPSMRTSSSSSGSRAAISTSTVI